MIRNTCQDSFCYSKLSSSFNTEDKREKSITCKEQYEKNKKI